MTEYVTIAPRVCVRIVMYARLTIHLYGHLKTQCKTRTRSMLSWFIKWNSRQYHRVALARQLLALRVKQHVVLARVPRAFTLAL